MLVCYHNDPDGLTAAWLFWKKYPEAHYQPMHYGNDFTYEGFKRIVFVDFCPNREILLELAKEHEVIVLDHHVSQGEVAAEFGVYDPTKAGCRLAWEYLHGNEESPWIVDYVEDRDLWKWELPSSREVNASIQSYNLTFSVWEKLSQLPLSYLISDGIAILRYQRQGIDSHKSKAKEINLAGHIVLAVQCTDMRMISDIAGELAEGRDFGVCFFDVDGYRVFSLRSRGDFDVSVLAKSFGGGGHSTAAGFRIPLI